MAGVAIGDGIDGGETASVEVPVTAVFSPDGSGQSYVWTIDESSSTVSRRPVEIEALADSGVTIQSGLEPGEWIAIAGVHYLEEGQQVSILNAGEQE